MKNSPLIDTASKDKLLTYYGGTFSVMQFADAVGLTFQDLEKSISNGDLLCFKKESNSFSVPVWQEHNGVILRGLKDALLELSKTRRSNWSKLLFMITPNDYLIDELAHIVNIDEVTPVDALRRTHMKEVLKAIEVFDR